MSVFYDKVSRATIDGDIKEPELIDFINTKKALRLIQQSINDNKYILIHCDIDMDGIGSGYIFYKFFALENCLHKVKLLINKERTHGITKDCIDKVNSLSDIGLLIILDSSSNDPNMIEQLNTNVLVIDHHIIEHDRYIGNTQKGDYVIVSNMIETPTYQIDKRMSCGLVVYELLRHYYKGTLNKLDEEYMFNWVCVTLITDAILLDNSRNQYYIQKTLECDDVEHNLNSLLKECKQMSISKNAIQYYIAPRINSAIRAEQSIAALNCVIFNPLKLSNLSAYKDMQQKYLQDADNNIKQTKHSILKNITDTGVSKSYCGVIASQLCNKYHKNTVTYKVENGICKGSFRGRCDNVKYRDYFKKNCEFAQGHDTAFGFRAKAEELAYIMNTINEIEPNSVTKFYLSLGNIPDNLKGKYHIQTEQEMQEFKKQRNLLQLAIINSRLSSQEVINILIKVSDTISEVDEYGIYTYSLFGTKAKSFKSINTEYAILYVEYSTAIDIYIKEFYFS